MAGQAPVVVAAFERLQLGDQPAHAVPHQHHLVQGRLAVLRVEHLPDLGQVVPQLAALIQNGWPVGYR